MIKHILFSGTAALALLAACAMAHAQAIDTRIGKLELQNGYPSKATGEKLYGEMYFQRVTQAFIWALPAVGFHGLYLAHRNTFGAKDGDVVLYQSLQDKAGMLTPEPHDALPDDVLESRRAGTAGGRSAGWRHRWWPPRHLATADHRHRADWPRSRRWRQVPDRATGLGYPRDAGLHRGALPE